MTNPEYEKGEYSVAQTFTTGYCEYVRRFVSAKEAFAAFQHYTTSAAVKLGVVAEVVITDAVDCTNMHWTKDKGLVYPTKELIEEAVKEHGGKGE